MPTVAEKLADYLRVSINNEPKWHYQQRRPMNNFGVPPDREQTTDCSGQSTSAYFWAGAPDPNGPEYSYNGYGYTGTLINNPKVSAPYEIGDLGIYGTSYGNTTHVVTCYLPGDSGSARWCSHGSEAAPYAVALHYRSDLLCVVRPGLGDGNGGGDVSIPDWFWPWADWYLNTSRDKSERPESAPDKIPEWGWEYMTECDKLARNHGMTEGERDWSVWYLDGKEGERPEVPQTIPERWWDDAEFVNQQRRHGGGAG